MYIEKCMAFLNVQEVYCECKDQTKSFRPKSFTTTRTKKNYFGPKFKEQ